MLAAPPDPMVDADQVLGRAPRALWRSGSFGVVVLAPGAPVPIALEGSGAALWDALDLPKSRRELVTELADRYASSPATIAADIAPVIDELVELGVLELDR